MVGRRSLATGAPALMGHRIAMKSGVTWENWAVSRAAGAGGARLGLPAHHVPRPRLTDSCRDERVVTVEAAGGDGKSVLAAELVDAWGVVPVEVLLDQMSTGRHRTPWEPTSRRSSAVTRPVPRTTWRPGNSSASTAAARRPSHRRASGHSTPACGGLTPWLGSAVGPGQYSLPARFGARNAGIHGMCAYLIHASTGVTYAHNSIWWNNHN